jgi:hypothetical protein
MADLRSCTAAARYSAAARVGTAGGTDRPEAVVRPTAPPLWTKVLGHLKLPLARRSSFHLPSEVLRA